MPVAYYLLMQGNVQRFKHFITESNLDGEDCLYLFPILYAIEPALLRQFFAIAFANDSESDQEIFEAAAPVAMSLDASLSDALIAIARENGWAEPVAARFVTRIELADDPEAGGDVHMQPLVSVAKLVIDFKCVPDYFASLTLKTAANLSDLRFHVAAGNVLCAFSDGSKYSLSHSQL